MARKKSTDIAKHKPGGVPILAGRMQKDARRGHATRPEDMAIAFIGVLQDLSPQIKKREAKYIEGSEVGDLFNNVTNELWKGDEGILVIPCAFESKYVEWVPRAKGGGFVQAHDVESDIMERTERVEVENGYVDRLPNGNEILLTAYHYVLVLDGEGGATRAMIAMAKTSLKKSRAWNTMISQQQLNNGQGGKFNPPSFGYTYRVKSGEESNAMNTWFNWVIETSGLVEHEGLYDEAESFAAAMEKGEVNRSYAGVDGEKSDDDKV
jgi:hypothetical protein